MLTMIIIPVEKNKRLVWQRRILLTVVAAISSILIHLLLPETATTQPAIIPSTSYITPHYRTFHVPKKLQGNIIGKVKLNSDKKVIALTFDDGPSAEFTPQILDILRENNVKATFFLVGHKLRRFPKIGQQIVNEGHALGNHTWHHWNNQMTEFTASREIEDTAALMYETTGVKTSLFRPPNGFLNNGLADYARKRKDTVVLWSVDSGDWRGSRVSVENMIKQVVEKATPGGIVLMHDAGGDRSRTVQALPKIIEELTLGGYKFVTVPELLEMSK
jgi:peptidoglycan/xylan/chitin deacetylase (PgdA/CDA1 family)